VAANKGPDFSKALVLGVIVANVAFTCAVLLIFLRTGSEPQVLVGAWFTFTTGELYLLAGIKKKKIEKGGDSQ